ESGRGGQGREDLGVRLELAVGFELELVRLHLQLELFTLLSRLHQLVQTLSGHWSRHGRAMREAKERTGARVCPRGRWRARRLAGGGRQSTARGASNQHATESWSPRTD